jgi:hypothetical protein
MKILSLLMLALAPAAPLRAQAPDSIPMPESGRQLTGSTRIEPGRYLRPARGAEGVLRLVGLKDVVLDLTGVELRGQPQESGLERAEGYGIVIRNCENLTVIGGRIGGYKGCLVADNCRNLVIDGTQFDGWYGLRLQSDLAAEHPGDWLYPHENDQDQWLTNYGAAVRLQLCEGATLKNLRGRRGQNGILLSRSDGARVHDCDFSFLSGWGLAMYRSSRAIVDHNRFDYCVRGYSHGRYWRGQDSAAILLFERCCDNLFALNSGTHSGDGLFLYAGQDLVEGRARARGEKKVGGSDRNIIWRNDFSCAVANAVEATFSDDNWVIENVLSGSHQHGVWGGYSRRMLVWNNTIANTLGGAVSIEHGQECAIVENRIDGNEIGVELWWDEDESLVKGPLGSQRDTSSARHFVYGNRFAGNAADWMLTHSSDLVVGANSFDGRGQLELEQFTLQGGEIGAWMTGRNGQTASGRVRAVSLRLFDGQEPAFVRRARVWNPPELPGRNQVLPADRGVKPGLATIVMGEYGPWDFESGAPRPKPRLPGGLLQDCQWQAAWFSWAKGPDPREELAQWRALAARPLVQRLSAHWMDPWNDPEVRERVGTSRFGLVASTTVRIPAAGRYRLTTNSDDGIRVRVGERWVLENWTHHGPTEDTVELELAAGELPIVLEYFQIDGATALGLELRALP